MCSTPVRGQSGLDSTRIAVTDIVAAQQDGYRPKEIRTLFGASLSLAQVHAALAYYYDVEAIRGGAERPLGVGYAG